MSLKCKSCDTVLGYYKLANGTCSEGVTFVNLKCKSGDTVLGYYKLANGTRSEGFAF